METILIVDDEKKIRNIFGKLLYREGYKVLKAENAEEAHALLMTNNVDLVLLDINMPDAGGSVVYGIIEEFFCKTRVIVASVYPLDDQQHLIRGAVDYYDKSDSIKVLVKKVKTALPGARKNAIEFCEKRKHA
jgi:two-component system phosphate regulon response regulator PhoB